MRTLMDSTSGQYRVHTMTAVYLLDLDAMTFLRTRIEADATVLDDDGTPNRLIAIVECTVGERMHLKVGVDDGVAWTRLATTHVVRIEHVD